MMVMRNTRKTPFTLIDAAGTRLVLASPVVLEISKWGIVQVEIDEDGTSGFFVPHNPDLTVGSTTVTFRAETRPDPDGPIVYVVRSHDVEVVTDTTPVLKVAVGTPVVI